MAEYKNFSNLRKVAKAPLPEFAEGEAPVLNRYGNIPGGLSQEELARELVLREMAGLVPQGTPEQELESARELEKGLDLPTQAASLSSALQLEKLMANAPKGAGFSAALRKAARDVSQTGMEPSSYVKVDPERARRIADAFENMKHDPSNPEVREAYEALAREVQDQYKKVKDMGINVLPIEEGMANPYPGGSKDLIADLEKNKRIYYYPTDQGFGSGTQSVADNPLLADTAEMAGGKKMKVNDQFRVVHDVFGHAKEGTGFGPVGEENAWQAHRAMFSPKAARAMTTETRGQNSWVNYGPFGAQNRANPANTRYAEQKTGLLPEWVMDEGVSPMTSEAADLQRSSAGLNAARFASGLTEEKQEDTEEPVYENKKLRELARILKK